MFDSVLVMALDSWWLQVADGCRLSKIFYFLDRIWIFEDFGRRPDLFHHYVPRGNRLAVITRKIRSRCESFCQNPEQWEHFLWNDDGLASSWNENENEIPTKHANHRIFLGYCHGKNENKNPETGVMRMNDNVSIIHRHRHQPIIS